MISFRPLNSGAPHLKLDPVFPTIASGSSLILGLAPLLLSNNIILTSLIFYGWLITFQSHRFWMERKQTTVMSTNVCGGSEHLPIDLKIKIWILSCLAQRVEHHGMMDVGQWGREGHAIFLWLIHSNPLLTLHNPLAPIRARFHCTCTRKIGIQPRTSQHLEREITSPFCHIAPHAVIVNQFSVSMAVSRTHTHTCIPI